MSRYTDTDELLKELNSCKYSAEKLTKKQEAYNFAISDMCRSIDSMPTIDTVEVKHGRWIDDKIAFHRVCSECGAVVRQDISLVYLLECMEKVGSLNYCPNCGCRMDLEEDEDG